MADEKTMTAKSVPEARDGSIAEGAMADDSGDADLALRVLREIGHFEYTPEEERAVVRKIDLWLMPVMALTFGLYATDKGAIAYAALFDFREANHLVGQRYALLTTIFFIGWLVWEYPGNLIAQKFPIAKYLCAIVLIWGICIICMAACHNFAGLAALRFILGMCEASIQPLLVTMIGMFYKREEQASRVCFFYGFNSLNNILGGPMAYAIGSLDTTFPRWKIFFLTLGTWTLLWSVVMFVVLPDSPMTARFKTDKERYIAIDRLRQNRTGIKNSKIKVYQILEALKDPAVWIFFFWLGAACTMNIFGSFITLLIKGLGFGVLDTALFTMPGGGIQLFGTFFNAFLCHKFPNRRGFIICGMLLLPITGSAMLMGLPQSQKWVRLAGVWLITFVATIVPVLLSYSASNLGGYTKRSTSLTLTFIAFSIGNIVSPQLFLDTEAPVYGTALRSMLVAACLMELLTVALLLLYYFRNKRRDKVQGGHGHEMGTEDLRTGLEDHTDFEDVDFRYMY